MGGENSIYRFSIDEEHNVRVAENLYVSKDYAREIFDIIKEAPMKEKKYEYSDIGFYYIPMIVEMLTNQSFEDYLEENFYKPLCLKNTFFKPLKHTEKDNIVPTEDDKTFRKQLSKVDQAFRKHAESTLLNEPCVEVVDLPDIKTIDGDFLKHQIEHAFRLRREIKQVRSLSKNDFFRYILPYRAMADYPIVETNDTYAPYYRKYLRVESGDSLSTIIRRYNLTTRRRRYFGGRYPFETLTGFPELFYLGMTDCTPLSNYGALALRACGVPAITEFNIAYKLWNGAHQHTAVMDANGFGTHSVLNPDFPNGEIPASGRH